MARLSFQNVPTKSGGVISGNISTGAGSPFGAGGKYEAQVAGIKAEIEKKPVGYYDPPPLTLWKEDNPSFAIDYNADPIIQQARKKIQQLSGVYDPAHPRASKIGRYGSQADIFAYQQLHQQQHDIINAQKKRLLAERNAPIIQAQQEQQAREADLERKLEIELAVQRELEKQVINQRPTPTLTPTTPATTLTFPIIPIIIIAVIVGIFLLRRRA